MADDRKYWVAFSKIRGIGSVRFNLLITKFGSLADAWHGDIRSLKEAGLTDNLIQAIITERKKIDPDALYEEILKKDIGILCVNDSDYPPLLRQIATPPPILYYRGTVSCLQKKTAAIVGTRLMTAHGKRSAASIARVLAENGIVVVSGLARGVDSVAHQVAIDSGGETVAVLGSGVDVIYPAEHKNLAKMIEKNGIILSDYAPGTRPERQNFPPRNRIISGLSYCSIIIEAGEKSGSLITARFAAEQGREVFVAPGPFGEPQSLGTNRLIRDGARPLVDLDELLSFLDVSEVETLPFMPQASKIAFEEPLEKQIVDLICCEALHLDEIARQLSIPAGVLSGKMMLLELKGFVEEVAPNMYRKNPSLF